MTAMFGSWEVMSLLGGCLRSLEMLPVFHRVNFLYATGHRAVSDSVQLLVAVYRAERSCMLSAPVTTNCNKCLDEFQRRLTLISDASRRQRPPAYSQHSACILSYVHVPVHFNAGESSFRNLYHPGHVDHLSYSRSGLMVI